MIYLPILILSIFFAHGYCDLKILPIDMDKEYGQMDSSNILKDVSLTSSLIENKNYKKVRRFKCIEVIEFIDEDTGEVVDEQVIRNVKPKILVSTKRNEIKNLIGNIAKSITTTPFTTTTSYYSSSEIAKIKIFHKIQPKHLSNGYFKYKNSKLLDRFIEKKNSDTNNNNNNEMLNEQISFTKSEDKKEKTSNYGKVNDEDMTKSIYIPKIIEDHKKIHNTSEIKMPLVSQNKNYNDSSLAHSKNENKKNVTSLGGKNSSNHVYNLPESPTYIPNRPEYKYYPDQHQNFKKANYGKSFNTRVYAKSDFKKITEDESIERNVLFTTPKPMITPSISFMNQAPLIKPKFYNTSTSKQKNLLGEQSSKNNLIMTKENCQKMNYLAKTFGIGDVQKWIRNNCVFARFYLPQATCQDIYTFVDSCFKKFFL